MLLVGWLTEMVEAAAGRHSLGPSPLLSVAAIFDGSSLLLSQGQIYQLRFWATMEHFYLRSPSVV